MRIVRNDDGAVMVIAVFMAMIVIGGLYYLSGLGAAIVAQERMQDAADAAAFSSAVIHARGMNLLALINIILASLLAILVMLAMLSSLLGLGAKILFAVSFFVPPAAGAAVELEAQSALVTEAEIAMRGPVEGSMRAMSGVQKILKQAIPILANVNALKLSRESYAPVVQAGITFPILKGLPAVDGDFGDLCKKSGEYAAKLVMTPINAVMEHLPGSGYVLPPLKKFARRGGETYAAFYCADGPKPKPPTHTVEIAIPKLETSAQVGCEKHKQQSDCEKYAKEIEDVQKAYNIEEGECDSPDAEAQRLCNVRRRKARSECDPRKNRAMTRIMYRKVDNTRHFRLEGEGKNVRVVEDPMTKEQPRPRDEKVINSVVPILCRLPGHNFGFSQNDYTDWEFDPAEPLCTERIDEPTLAEFAREGVTSIDRTFEEYTDVLGCVVEEKLVATVSEQQASEEMKKSKPQEMCNCAAQGESMFQIHSIVLGDASALTADASKKILVATGGRSADEGVLEEIGELAGRFAMAQAEFYFDDANADKAEWLWTMNWKARMRRLNFGRQKWECPAKENTCEKASGDGAKQLVDKTGNKPSITKMVKGDFDSLIVH